MDIFTGRSKITLSAPASKQIDAMKLAEIYINKHDLLPLVLAAPPGSIIVPYYDLTGYRLDGFVGVMYWIVIGRVPSKTGVILVVLERFGKTSRSRLAVLHSSDCDNASLVGVNSIHMLNVVPSASAVIVDLLQTQ